MNTTTGLRFLQVLARRGERVPSYLLPGAEPRGAQHEHTVKPNVRDEASSHIRYAQR